MQIIIDTLTNLSTLASAVTIKAGSQVPVSVAFQTGGAPATLGGTPLVEVALSGQSVPARVLAYLNTFAAGASSTYSGDLDCTDTRLVGYMSDKAAATLNLEVAWTIGGERYISPNLSVAVQQAIMSGPQTSNGGPTYLTTLGGLGLPTSDPHVAGALWINGSAINVSLG